MVMRDLAKADQIVGLFLEVCYPKVMGNVPEDANQGLKVRVPSTVPLPSTTTGPYGHPLSVMDTTLILQYILSITPPRHLDTSHLDTSTP